MVSPDKISKKKLVFDTKSRYDIEMVTIHSDELAQFIKARSPDVVTLQFKGAKPQKHFLCKQCIRYFPSDKGRLYCGRSCRDAAYYLRKTHQA